MSIKIEQTSQSLSSFGGLVHLGKVIEFAGIKKTVSESLPPQKTSRKSNAWQKCRALISGFVVGADCLDDLDVLATDSGFRGFNEERLVSSQTYGSFLRAFDFENLLALQYNLRTISRTLRRVARPLEKNYIVDLDSTSHLQTGRKMEGLAYNYKNQWCLDSLQAYDQFGFPLYFSLRSGNTHTSHDAPLAIHHCFHGLDRKFKRFFRADSGYANKDVFNACHSANVKFVIAARGNVVHAKIEKITNWKKSNKLKFHDGRDTEIGSIVYRTPDHNETLKLVVMRTEAVGPQQRLYRDYEYHGWVTNIGRHEMTDEKVILFYRKRGHAENFIKETKGNFDLRHFPCQKLRANEAYGFIGMIAHGLTRFLSLVVSPKKHHFAKKVRQLIFYKPVQVIRHARQCVFRFTEHHYWEACIWQEKLHTVINGS